MYLLVGPNIHIFHLFPLEENVAKLPGQGLEQPCTCLPDWGVYMHYVEDFFYMFEHILNQRHNVFASGHVRSASDSKQCSE